MQTDNFYKIAAIELDLKKEVKPFKGIRHKNSKIKIEQYQPLTSYHLRHLPLVCLPHLHSTPPLGEVGSRQNILVWQN